MIRKLIFIFLLMLLTSCVGRVAMYAPRRNNTKQHREVKENSECLDCHSNKIEESDHKETEDCLRCHKLCEGC